MSYISDDIKNLKRKGNDGDERTFHSDKKRRKKEGKTPKARPKHYPLSERQQLALLMQMTAEENHEQSSTPPPSSKKTPGGSGKKDKVNKRNERGETALHIATIRGEMPLIIDLIKQGADINVQDYAGWTPLHEACNHGHQEIAKFLLEAGATVNSKGLDNDYPLHDAVINEHVDLVELLLKHGANPLLSNKNGERPLDMTNNEEIIRLMQNEIISSDDSDRPISPVEIADKKASKKLSNIRLGSESDQSEQSSTKTSTSTASRELFKQFDSKPREKHILSSSESDDSEDDIPLSRRRKSITQASSASSVTSIDTISTLPSKKGNISSTGASEKKLKSSFSHKRLISTESSDSTDSDMKFQRHENKFSDFKAIHKQPSKGKDEAPPSNVAQIKSIVSEKPDENKLSLKAPKTPKVAVVSSSSGEPDVYDFSPNADEFSMESDGISLKPEHKVFSKWETSASIKSPPKQTTLFSRKPQSIFSSSKVFDLNLNKARKTSWDSVRPTLNKTDKDSDEKTVLIKPVFPETSEMMFDRLFKSPKKDTSDVFSYDGKLRSPVLSPKNPPLTTISSIVTTTVTTFTRTGTTPVTSIFSSNAIVSPRAERTKTFAPSLIFSPRALIPSSASVVNKHAVLTPERSFSAHSRSFSQSEAAVSTFSSVKTVSSVPFTTEPSKRLDKSLTKLPPATTTITTTMAAATLSMTHLDSPKFVTSRSLSLDAGSKVETKKNVEIEQSSKGEPSVQVENKQVKKLMKIEGKEKLSKTVSDPVRKPPSKPALKDSKLLGDMKRSTSSSIKATPQTPPKKESKSEPKKAPQLSLSSKSSFINDIESISKQRHQEKLKRKKVLVKKSKPNTGVKPDDKKVTKKPEVKLLDTDSWLGSPVEKNTSEKPKKLQQRSVKKLSDASSDSSTVTLQQDDKQSSLTKLSTLTDPLISEQQNLVQDKNSKPPFLEQHLLKPDAAKLFIPSGFDKGSTKSNNTKAQSSLPNQNTPTGDSSTDISKFPQQYSMPNSYSAKGFVSPSQEFGTPDRLTHPIANAIPQLASDSSPLTATSVYHPPPFQQSPLQNTQSQTYDSNKKTILSPSSELLQNPGNRSGIPIAQLSMPSPSLGTLSKGDVVDKKAHGNLANVKDPEQLIQPDLDTSTTAATVTPSNVPIETSVTRVLPAQSKQTLPESADELESSSKDVIDAVDTDMPKSSDVSNVVCTDKPPLEEKLSEEERMLREYIQQRLSLATIRIERRRKKRLPVYIPLQELMERKKDPAVDKLNVYEERVAIQKKMFEKRKNITTVIPQAPHYYWEYMTFTGGYLLNGSKESRLSVPVLAPPPSLCEPMVQLFNAHEDRRVRLRVQHAIQREKLVISCEQEIMRVHSRAARTIQNQQIPFSACAMLMDNEVYYMPRTSSDSETGKASIRDRFNARMFLSWLQDVDDKYDKMKTALLARQKHEAEAMFAVQRTEWILKRQELDHSQRALKANEINEVYVPMVNIADDFVLLPA